MGLQHFAEAEQAVRQAVEMHGRLHGPRHVETAWGLLTLGNSLTMQRKYAEAEAALREALAIFRQLYSVDHHSLDSTFRSLRQVLEARGDRAGLDALAREELEDAATVTDQAVVDGRLKQAQIYADLREWKKASDALEEAVALTKSKDGPRRDKILTAYVRLSSAATDRREWNEASGALEQAVALTESSDVSQRDKVIDAYLGLSWSAYLQQEFDIMERAARTATEIAPSHSRAHNILGVAMATWESRRGDPFVPQGD